MLSFLLMFMYPRVRIAMSAFRYINMILSKCVDATMHTL